MSLEPPCSVWWTGAFSTGSPTWPAGIRRRTPAGHPSLADWTVAYAARAVVGSIPSCRADSWWRERRYCDWNGRHGMALHLGDMDAGSTGRAGFSVSAMGGGAFVMFPHREGRWTPRLSSTNWRAAEAADLRDLRAPRDPADTALQGLVPRMNPRSDDALQHPVGSTTATTTPSTLNGALERRLAFATDVICILLFAVRPAQSCRWGDRGRSRSRLVVVLWPDWRPASVVAALAARLIAIVPTGSRSLAEHHRASGWRFGPQPVPGSRSASSRWRQRSPGVVTGWRAIVARFDRPG